MCRGNKETRFSLHPFLSLFSPHLSSPHIYSHFKSPLNLYSNRILSFSYIITKNRSIGGIFHFVYLAKEICWQLEYSMIKFIFLLLLYELPLSTIYRVYLCFFKKTQISYYERFCYLINVNTFFISFADELINSITHTYYRLQNVISFYEVCHVLSISIFFL